MVCADGFIFIDPSAEFRPLHHHDIICETVFGHIVIKGFYGIGKILQEIGVLSLQTIRTFDL